MGRTESPFVPISGKHQLTRNNESAIHNQSRWSVWKRVVFTATCEVA